MSIKIKSPSIVLNSDAWDVLNYEMDESMEVAKGADIEKVFDTAAKKCESLKRRSGSYVHMVINCHGYSRNGNGGFGLSLGSGVRRNNAYLFGKFSPTVSKIYLIACRPAAISEPGGDGDGNLFCGAVAKYAQATVLASLDKQIGNVLIHEDMGYVDDWEGTVLTYGPDGNVIEVQTFD